MGLNDLMFVIVRTSLTQILTLKHETKLISFHTKLNTDFITWYQFTNKVTMGAQESQRLGRELSILYYMTLLAIPDQMVLQL